MGGDFFALEMAREHSNREGQNGGRMEPISAAIVSFAIVSFALCFLMLMAMRVTMEGGKD